jgi:hypothetical protein
VLSAAILLVGRMQLRQNGLMRLRKKNLTQMTAPGRGLQFTSFAWTVRLRRVSTRTPTDGKRRCLDDIFTERISGD